MPEVKIHNNYCVDQKSHRSTVDLKEILLILYCNDNKRYVNAIPIENEEKTKYEKLVQVIENNDLNFILEEKEIIEIINSSLFIESPFKSEINFIQAKIVKCTKTNFGTSSSCAFRVCPLCKNNEGYFNPFCDMWWYDVNEEFEINKPEGFSFLGLMKRQIEIISQKGSNTDEIVL